MITVAQYDYWPQSVRDWLQSLGWEEVNHISFNQEILPDGYVEDSKGQRWAKWKHGKHVTVSVRCGREMRVQKFTKSTPEWEVPHP